MQQPQQATAVLAVLWVKAGRLSETHGRAHAHRLQDVRVPRRHGAAAGLREVGRQTMEVRQAAVTAQGRGDRPQGPRGAVDIR